MNTEDLNPPGLIYAQVKTADDTEITLSRGSYINTEIHECEYKGIRWDVKGPSGKGSFELSRANWAELIQLVSRWQPRGPFI